MKQNDSRASKTGVWRRLLSVVLAVCMVISMTPAVIAEDSPATTAEGTPEPVTQATEPAETAPTEPTVTEPVPEVTTPADPAPEVTDPTDPAPEVTDPTEPVPEEPIPEEPVPDSEQVELIKQLISELPFEVTEENSEEVRARLQDILNLYSQLTPAEQEAVDITPCFMLQAQLDEIDSAATLAGGADEASATPVTGNDDTWEDGYYKVSGEITNSNRVTVRGNVTLILEANSKLTIKSIFISNGSSLTIKGSGELVADCTTTNEGFAGIDVAEGSTLVIESGTVTARGGIGSAGIGGHQKTSCGSITISGGNVTAIGADYAAGIGGGDSGNGGNITITGGTVNAIGVQRGAGIGGGYDGSAGNITISGGSVTATGYNNFGAGIGGGGYNTAVGTVTITGGTVIATGFNGIGDGKSGSGCTFSTGVNGNAVIIASSISDTSNQAHWSGLIFNENDGKIYGSASCVINNSLTIESGKTLTINEGSSLTVPAGVTLTVDGTITNNGTIINYGTISISHGGDITGAGIIDGTGSFTTEKLTEDMVIAPTDIVSDSADRSEDVKAGMLYQPVTICGKEFTLNLSAWTVSATKVDDSTYTVNYTHTNGAAFSTTVSLLPAVLTVTAVEIADKAYDGNTDAIVAGVTFTDPNGVEVIVASGDYTAMAVFDTPYAGTDKTVTVTVALAEGSNFTLKSGELTATGNITPRTLTENDITVTLDNDTYTWAGEEIKPIPTLTWDNNGTPVTIDPSEYVVSYSNNGGEGSSFGFDKTPEVCITAKEDGNYSFDVIYISFEITCNHNFGVTGGCCNGCGKQADVEVIDGTTSQGYFGTTDAPIDKAKLEEIVKNADAQSRSSGNPVTVKLYSGWTVPSNFSLKVNDKINFVADENQEFKADSIFMDSPAAELTLDISKGTFATVTSSWESVKFTLNNGTITQKVSLSDNNSFIMNGGTVGYISDTAKTAPSSVTITGGTVRKTLTALPATNLTVTGGTIGELIYNGTGTVTNTKLSGGSFTTITMPDGEQVSSILAAGYAFYNAADNTEVTDTSVNTLSNVFVAKAGSHVVSADLDFTGEVANPGVLETDGYHWESIPSAADESRMTCTLTLKDCIVPGNIALPDNAESITINLQGESSVGGFVSTKSYKNGDYYNDATYGYHMTITGSGSLNVGGTLGSASGSGSTLVIDTGATVTVNERVESIGTITVNGNVSVLSMQNAVYTGKLSIGAGGKLAVSGSAGVTINGINDGSVSDFTNAFVIADGGSFTADCRDSNIIVNAIPGLTEQQIASVFSIPDYYLPDGYSVRYASDEYSGVLTIIPETVSDAAILSCTGMGGQLKLKYQPYTAEVDPAAYDYTGSAIIPTVVVTNITDGATIDPANYTVTAKNNTLPGTATATIQGIGEYDFTITRTFEINCTHTAGNKDTGECSICHKQMAVGAIRYNYSTQKTECKFFDDLVDAWNYALDNSCDNLSIYADVTVDQVLEIPAGMEMYLNVKNNKTLTGTAESTIDVYGTLVLGEGTIKNANNCSIRVYADADEYDHTVFKMDEQNKTVDGVEVYGTGKVELRACRVTDHITVREGRTVKELLYVESTYKSADGWFTEDALNATTLRGPVDIVDAPVAFQTGFSESKLNPEYKQGSNAEPLFARLYSTDIPAVQLQWYTIVDGTETPIEGATELTYTPSVAEVGVTQYFCQGTLDGYTARSEIFTVTVTPCEHTAINAENNTCADCGTPLAAKVSYASGSGEPSETPAEFIDKYFENFADAWECAAAAPSDYVYVAVFADQTVEAPLAAPEGKRISLSSDMGIDGGTATITGTGEATVIVNGELNLGGIVVRNDTHHAIRVDSAVSGEGEYALSLTPAGSSPTVVDGLDVINGSVMIYGGTVEDHITLPEGRKISELLEEYSGKTFKYVAAAADGVSRWMSAAELDGNSVNESVTVAQMPVRFLNTDTLTCRYEKGAAAEALAYDILYSDAYPNASADVSVQWYKKTSADAEPVLIEGAAATSYTPDTSATGITQYYCVITLDGYTATSGIYEVTVTEMFTVTVTSAVEGGDGTIAPVQGGGQYEYGQEATVTAEGVEGCKFLGWYIGSRQVSADFSYTFTVTENIDLVAKYESYGTATVTIEGINGAEFMVNHGAAQSTYTAEAPVGTQITITAADPARVSAWLNGSDKVIGKGENIIVTVTGNTTIKLMYTADGASGKAMVEYVSGYGQLLSYEYYSASDTIVEPVAPSKLGYTFTGWSLTAAEIQAKIAAGEKQITVTPVYTQNDTTFTVTVKYGDGTSETHAVAQGSGFTAVAKTIDGKVFTCWTDSDNKILSYEPNYLIRVSSDVTLIAVYANEPVKAKPVIAITDKFASVVNNKNKVSFTATRSIPEGYKLIEHGVLYGTDASLAQESALVLDGANVKKGQSSSVTPSGVYTMNISVGNMTDTTIYARGYMIVQNLQTNNIETIYSLIESGNFNGLGGNK